MDLLYSGKVNAFCIVSSDSDFTKLIIRLKEDNMYLIGMGESKTPEVLVNSYERFYYIDQILEALEPKKERKDANGKSLIPKKEVIIEEVKKSLKIT